jgi:type III secretion protein U
MSGEKTEEPTEKRLDDARKKGQVPQRKYVLEAFILTGGVLGINGLWPSVAAHLADTMDKVFEGIAGDFHEALDPALDSAFEATRVIIMMSLALGIALLIFNLLINKFNFAPEAMTPKFEKLNPVNGLKGLFSKNTLYSFIRLMIYFPTISLITYFLIQGNISNALNAASCGLPCLADIFNALILQCVILILLVLIIMAAVDFKLQNMMFITQNKMSKDDVKQEYKGSQGDPLIKGKRQQISREDMYMPSPKDVTHVIFSNSYLVAILYRPGKTPFVVMKAKGDSVPKVLSRFKQMGVHCVNLPAVAREFHMRYTVGNFMDGQAAGSMYKVLQATR